MESGESDMVIRYLDGSYVEGAVCGLTGATVTIAIAGIDHTVEYRLVQGRWTSKSGVLVTFEFPAARGVEFLKDLPAGFGDRTGLCAAGGECAVRRAGEAGGAPPN